MLIIFHKQVWFTSNSSYAISLSIKVKTKGTSDDVLLCWAAAASQNLVRLDFWQLILRFSKFAVRLAKNRGINNVLKSRKF